MAMNIMQELCLRKPWDLKPDIQLNILMSARLQQLHDALCVCEYDGIGWSSETDAEFENSVVIKPSSSEDDAEDRSFHEALQSIPLNVLELVFEICREEKADSPVDHLIVRQMLDELGDQFETVS